MEKSKQQIRAMLKDKRMDMSRQEVMERSARVQDQVLATEEFQKADTVCLYLPIHNEVEMEKIIQACRASGKRTAAPRIRDGQMEFFYFDSETDLAEGFYGIREPKGNGAVSWDRDKMLMIMPGVAFDEAGHRIGHGGGYYDRYLARCPKALGHTMAVCYDFQILPRVPAESFDIRPRKIVAETRIIGYI